MRNLLSVAFLLVCAQVLAQAPTPPASDDYLAEPAQLTFVGVRPGMTVSEAIAAINTTTLPAFSGFSTPVQSHRFGDDQNGMYVADYGPSLGKNPWGLPLPSIRLEVSWLRNRVSQIEAINHTLTYDQLLAILVKAYGQPDRTYADHADPDPLITRYAEWHRNGKVAVDVLRLEHQKSEIPGFVDADSIAIERRLAAAYYLLRKTTDEFEQSLATAATAQNPGLAYFRVCTAQYNSGNVTGARIACDRSIAADPARAEAYYIKGTCLYLYASARGKTGYFPVEPGTVEALTRYLELAPAGPFAADVKVMLDDIKSQLAKK